jgi:hypothetical protein
MSLWQQCQGEQNIKPIQGVLLRLVESQEQIATLGYVDTLEEQALLESLLDDTKPSYPTHCQHLHYLLKTPFRYPPLKWGSRFGQVHEPGIFYGGSSVHVTLAEAAYYRLVFWDSMTGQPPKPQIQTAHTMFSVPYQTGLGISLQHPPFDSVISNITDRCHYQHTQQLGKDMRNAGVEAFEYPSARDPNGQLCVALFSAKALASNQPADLSAWLCEVSQHGVSFKAANQSHIYHFARSLFTEQDQLPLPASA